MFIYNNKKPSLKIDIETLHCCSKKAGQGYRQRNSHPQEIRIPVYGTHIGVGGSKVTLCIRHRDTN